MPAHFAHLDLFCALGDAVAAVVAVDMFERLMAGIADPAMYLHRPVGSIADQPVGAIVTHTDLVGELFGDLGLGHLIHLPRGLVDQQAEHFGIGLQLDERELDRLIGG